MEEENKLAFLDVIVLETQMTLLTQQFTGNQQIQIFTLTGIHIHCYNGRKQQLACYFKAKFKSVPIKMFK